MHGVCVELMLIQLALIKEAYFFSQGLLVYFLFLKIDLIFILPSLQADSGWVTRSQKQRQKQLKNRLKPAIKRKQETA